MITLFYTYTRSLNYTRDEEKIYQVGLIAEARIYFSSNFGHFR